MTKGSQRDRVIEYYKTAHVDYKLIYLSGDQGGMNYGYWDESVHNRREALVRLNEVLAQKIGLTSSDSVLDAGCGVGALSIWLVGSIGCQVTGITLAPNQVEMAKANARQVGVSNRVTFAEMDYTQTTYPPNTFSAAIAVETICHLEDKADFYTEMFRILRPGGRLIVAEYMTKKPELSVQDAKELGLMLDGWAIPNLWTPDAHIVAATAAGFSKVTTEEYSEKTLCVARYLYKHSIYGLPIYWLLNKLGILSDVRFKDAQACRYQWRTKERGVWGHYMLQAVKPS